MKEAGKMNNTDDKVMNERHEAKLKTTIRYKIDVYVHTRRYMYSRMFDET